MRLYDFSRHDRRIDQVCQDGLPGQPQVARYLARRLRECRGSVLVARIFVEALARVPCGRIVSQDDVERLGVDDQVTLLREVYPACNDDLKRDLSCELAKAFHEDSEPFYLDDESQPHWRRPSSISEQRGKLLAVFNCAYAMLRHVDIDPREAARARAAQRLTG